MLSPAEINYSVTEKECLAVIFSVRKFRPYLEGYPFKVITDHSSLRWLSNLQDPVGRLPRWALELQQYPYTIEHRQGALHQVPDALSRYYEQFASLKEIDDQWYSNRLADVAARPMNYSDWKIENDMLYVHRSSELLDPITENEFNWCLVVPKPLRNHVIHENHDAPSCGHLGISKTYERISRDYYWPSMLVDIRNHIRTCMECQRHKATQTGPVGLMGRRVTENPWDVVFTDFMEFPRSELGNNYLLVFQDAFTKCIEIIPTRAANGKTVLRAFVAYVLCRWGTPKYLVADHGTEFDNQLLREALAGYGVKLTHMPPYHPQANLAEHANQTLKSKIRIFAENDQTEWDVYAAEFRHAINSAVQTSMKVSPMFLYTGRHPRPRAGLRNEAESSENIVIDLDNQVNWTERMKRLRCLRDQVSEFMNEAQLRQKAAYDIGKRDVTF